MKSRAARFLRLLPVLLASVGGLSAGTVSGKVSLLDDGRVRSDAANVVVWVEGLQRAGRPAESSQAKASESVPSMRSTHKRFTPKVLAVELGRSVSFPNDDPIFHNVFSVSGENHFDLGLYRRGRSKDKSFESPGLVRVYCNIHPQMIGFIRVVDSSFFTVTGPDGRFDFDGVPDGERTLKAWCDEGGETSAVVHVSARKSVSASLSLDVSGFKPQAHKNKYGQDYPPPPPDEDRY
ncbi:MAG: cupredoxin domain-containing protein [Thermoanaerobaculia bacterium]